ncbi:MAG: aspartate kinase [Verrucomicrobia bacterium]|nr:aspartate kinase [Verrucomicrobiota bacterium]
MKFGGASVSSSESFAQVADIIKSRCQEYSKIVVVVSAMKGATDQLLQLAKKVHDTPPRRELDMLVSVGERISISLLAMALSLKGVDAISFTGSQSGIITTCDHTEARIITVKPSRILRELEEGKVVIVAGFQGVSESGEITTLGRGGSDTSAVAMGVALGAAKVEFFKDVDGIYSADPKLDSQAIHYPFLQYDQALEIIRKGAKVLHSRAVELAKKNSLPLRVCSFFIGKNSNTIIIHSEKEPKYEGYPLYEIEFNK